MEEIDKGLLHSSFNAEIYKWTLTIPVGKWYEIDSVKKMPKEDFVNCIKYLINCGEQLTFKEDYSAFKRCEETNWVL